ncbi:MAG: ABC transporter permease [Candidatus Sulfotelmatobacter sp.]
MNTQSNAVPEAPLAAQGIAPAALSQAQPMYWSLRRELWENRSTYIAPLAAAAVYLIGFLISLFWVPSSMRGMAAHGPMPPVVVLAMPYSHAAMLLALTAFLVGIFYSLDALHGERRDRSILFWKSLPVSDLTTVLSKASVPLVVLPLLVVAITVTLQLVMRLVSLAVLAVSGAGAATLWTRLPLFQMELVLLYGTTVLALWHAPIYCWFLLVSGWARRATFLWAVLPLLAISAVEYIAFHTSHLGFLLHDRLFGFAAAAFDLKDKNGVPIDAHFIPLTQLVPGRFLSSPSLWVGLIVAAIFLAAAVRLRRYQGPI